MLSSFEAPPAQADEAVKRDSGDKTGEANQKENCGKSAEVMENVWRDR